MTEVEQQPQTNGIETIEEDESNKVRPADIEAVSSKTYFFHFYFQLKCYCIRTEIIMDFLFKTGYA